MSTSAWVQICCAWEQVLWLLLLLQSLKGLTSCLCFLMVDHLLLDLSSALFNKKRLHTSTLRLQTHLGAHSQSRLKLSMKAVEKFCQYRTACISPRTRTPNLTVLEVTKPRQSPGGRSRELVNASTFRFKLNEATRQFADDSPSRKGLI